jgi:predicted nucleotidyltransferase
MSNQPTRRRERAFEEFARAVEETLGDSIHDLILYGSTARSEATEQSDVDVLVVLNEQIQTEKLFQLAFDIGTEHGVAIVPHLQTRDHFESRQDHPFLKNVLSEGRSYG